MTLSGMPAEMPATDEGVNLTRSVKTPASMVHIRMPFIGPNTQPQQAMSYLALLSQPMSGIYKWYNKKHVTTDLKRPPLTFTSLQRRA